MASLLEVIALSALMVVSVASVLWYFRARKRMIKFIKEYTDELERELKPRSKEYVLLGYLVGYRAKYELEDGRKAYILLTTAPKYSFFYYPVAKALGREDRVTIILELPGRTILRDAHAVRKSESRLMNTLSRDLGNHLAKLSRSSIDTRQGVYDVLYEEPRDSDLLTKIINANARPLYKLSAYREFNAVEVVSKAEPGSVRELVKSLQVLVKGLSKGVQAS